MKIIPKQTITACVDCPYKAYIYNDKKLMGEYFCFNTHKMFKRVRLKNLTKIHPGCLLQDRVIDKEKTVRIEMNTIGVEIKTFKGRLNRDIIEINQYYTNASKVTEHALTIIGKNK